MIRGYLIRSHLTVLATAVVLGGGCSIGDIRRPPPSAAPSSASARPTPAAPAEVRQVRVPVPRDFGQPIVQFTDVAHGYAQFTRCPDRDAAPAADCTAMVFATADGGRSWQQLTHPRPAAQNHQLYPIGATLVLLAEPHGWYVSADRGSTFRHERGPEMPTAYRRLDGRFQLCCDGDDPPQIGEWVGDRFRPVPAQPPLRDLNSVAYDEGRLLVAGVPDGRPEASWSHDEGRTWWATAVPEPEGELSMVQLAVGRGDAWLIGHGDDRTRFPQLWRAQGDRWEKVTTAGHPQRFVSAVSLGAGLLAVTGPRGSGVIAVGDKGGSYNDLNWPLRDQYLRRLPDGTLFADGNDGTAWLGQGVFGDRRWIKLVLERT